MLFEEKKQKIVCLCGKEFEENEYEKHYKKCKPFFDRFKIFDFKFGEIIRQFSGNQEELLLAKFLLKQFIKEIELRLDIHFKNKNNNRQNINNIISENQNINKNQDNHNKFNLINVIKNKNNDMNNKVTNQNFFGKINLVSDNCIHMEKMLLLKKNQSFPELLRESKLIFEEERCQRCDSTEDIRPLECQHYICNNCFKKIAKNKFSNTKCNKCDLDISDECLTIVFDSPKQNIENKK